MPGRPTTTARRYAEAAFQLASRDGALDAWARDLAIAAEIVADERVSAVLDNPAIPRPEREKVIAQLIGSRVSKPVHNLLRVLVDRGRVELTPAIASEFRRLHNAQRGIVEAVVTTALPLTNDEAEAVRERVAAMAGATIELRQEIDESLIGGLTVKVGGRLLDASVRGRLERLREQLVAGTRTR